MTLGFPPKFFYLMDIIYSCPSPRFFVYWFLIYGTNALKNQGFTFFLFLLTKDHTNARQSSCKAESGTLAAVPSRTRAECPLSDTQGMTLRTVLSPGASF